MCTAGYKAMWSGSFPGTDFFAALDPRLSNVVDEKMSHRLFPLGARAGALRVEAAALTGLNPGTPVAVANVDAHVSVPAVTVTEPGTLVAIMGTSTCHILLAEHLAYADGMCGVAHGGVVPGLYGYEAGQSAVGDIFAWYVANAVPPIIHESARRQGISTHDVLSEEAARIQPGESGLLALDWWNGNRSVLVDADLRGLLVGMTLTTRPSEIYRALIEATAFGARVIVEAFERANLAVDEIVACGGLPERNPLLMQIYADVTKKSYTVPASNQAPALGSAMHAAVASGVFGSIIEASRQMARLSNTVYEPSPAHAVTYDLLYDEYRRLHDLFGRGGDDVMRRLKHIQHDATNAAPVIR